MNSAKTDAVRDILREIQFLQASQVPEASELRKVVSKTEFHLSVPDWWVRTEVCLSFEAEYARGSPQCTGEKSPLCAPVGSYTSFYRDDTHFGMEGGCLLSWAIRTEVLHADWFAPVEMCVKTLSKNPIYLKCDNGRDGEKCAPVNQFTRPMRDDTHRNNDDHCSMAWRMRHPDLQKTPAWFQNVRLCFNWFEEDDVDGECSASDFTLCAYVSEWTEFYTDHTDARYGGCQMRWKIENQL